MEKLTALVMNKNGKVFANSRDVAEYFGKLHKNVIRNIDSLIATSPSIATYFEPIELDVKVGFGVRKVRAFNMTRNGFTLLAMGFTGSEAMKFKLAYIKAYNEMEERLNANFTSFSDPAAAALAWAEQYRTNEAAGKELENLNAY